MLDTTGVILTQFLPAFVNSDVRNPMITTLECDGFAIQDTSTPTALLQLKSNEGGIQFGIPGSSNTGFLSCDSVNGQVTLGNLSSVGSGATTADVAIICGPNLGAPNTGELLVDCRPGNPASSGVRIQNSGAGSGYVAVRLATNTDMELDASDVGGNVLAIPGENKNFVVETDPSVSGNSQGIQITRTAPTAETASLLLNAGGDLNVNSTGQVVLIPQTGARAIVVSDDGLLVKPATEATGIGSIYLYNGSSSSNPTYYRTYNTSVTGGGNTAGELAIFGYSGASYGTIRRCITYTATGDEMTLGDDSISGGCVVKVAGSSGEARVYDTIYNTPPILQSITGIPFNGQIAYAIGDNQKNSSTTLIPQLVPGRGYIASGAISFIRYGYALVPGPGNYSVPTPMSVRIQFRWSGLSAPTNFTTGWITVPVGVINWPANPLANFGTWASFNCDLGTCPTGATGLFLYADGNDPNVSFESGLTSSLNLFGY
jgi:hypothetical protein